MRYTTRLITALLLLTLASMAAAEPRISLEVVAERETTVTAEDSTTSAEFVPAENVEPGQTLHYTVHYENSGTSTATNVRIDNPVPEGTRYVPDSARGEGTEIRFSVDGGETFKVPASLTWERTTADGETRREQARPETYNAIRWVVEEIPAGERGEVGFQVIVE